MPSDIRTETYAGCIVTLQDSALGTPYIKDSCGLGARHCRRQDVTSITQLRVSPCCSESVAVAA